MFCTQAFARFAARLHPQPAQPAAGDAPSIEAREGTAHPPAVAAQTRSAAAESDAASTSPSNGMKARP
jgi:hypothetical protein